MAKRPTMIDVAERAGVSQATVSLVLNSVPDVRISTSTRNRVVEAARELQYRNHRRSAEAPAGGMRTIGLLIDEVRTTPFATSFIEGARDEAARNDCLLAIYCTGGDARLEGAALDMLATTRLTGVLYTRQITQAVVPPDRLEQVPTVLLNCHERRRRFPSLVPGDLAGAFSATEHLLKAGHRRIAHLAGEKWTEAARDRSLGYRQAMTTWDVPFDPSLLVSGGWTLPGGRDMTARLLASPEPPTAIFCFNDRMALGACEAIRASGLRVPEDISVVGFDDEDLAAYATPPLTTVVLPHDEMARWAVSAVLDRDGTPFPEREARRIKIECPLVERGTVAPPHGHVAMDAGSAVEAG